MDQVKQDLAKDSTNKDPEIEIYEQRQIHRNLSRPVSRLALPPGGKIVCLGQMPLPLLATSRGTSQPCPLLLELMEIAVPNELCSRNNSSNEG